MTKRERMRDLKATLSAVYRKDYGALADISPPDVNATDADGRTPLMHAVLAGDSEMVGFLIDRRADVNIADRGQNWTALHFAADNENDENVRQLLEAGATVDAADTFGNTPLWRAVMSSGANLAAIRELLKYGADPHKKNNHGKAPVDIARESGRFELLRLLEAQR